MTTFRFKVASLFCVLWAFNAVADTELLNRRLGELESRLISIEELLERELRQSEQLKTKLDALAVAIHTEGGVTSKNTSKNTAKNTSKPTAKSAAKTTTKTDSKPDPDPKPEPKPEVFTLPKGTPQQQYKFATDLLLKKQYSTATKALNAFIVAHPKNGLVANARYWLGEAYYVQGDYQTAVQTFAAAYKDDEKGAKAEDNLLKMALSLRKLGNKDESCKVFASLKQRLAKKSKLFQDKVKKEAASCPN